MKIYLGRDAVSGRKHWAYRSFRGGKREAQRALAAMVAEADRGGLARTTSTVGDCWRSGTRIGGGLRVEPIVLRDEDPPEDKVSS